MQKRLLSVLLAFILMIQMFPIIAMANDLDADDLNTGDSLATGTDAVSLGFSLTSFADPWDGTTETEPTIEAGSYQIGLGAELAWFRTHVNNTAGCTSNAVLTADIDLNNYEWHPISMHGSINDNYAGLFDGDNHTISGLYINTAALNKGLFGTIVGATIKNLNVEGAIDCKTSNNIGGIVGRIQGAGTIEGCSFSGSVKGGYTGGIAGLINNSAGAKILNCFNEAAVTGTTAGGILGHSTQSAAIESCYNTGTIIGSNRSGGIVGQLSNGSLERCYNIGSVGGAASSGVGGIYSFSNITVKNCYYLYPEAETGDSRGNGSGSEKISSPDGLLAKLGTPFINDEYDINGGYPLLDWQMGNITAPDTTPSISLSGGTTIFVQADAGANETTISIALKNIDDSDIDIISWDVEAKNIGANAQDIVSWQTADGDDTHLVIKAKGGGAVTVTATVEVYGETLTATRDILVIPQITTAEIVNINNPGAVAMGQTVEVKVYVFGGNEYDYDNYPTLTYEWRYNSISSSASIPGTTGRTFDIPTTFGYEEWNYLYVEIKSDGAVVMEASDVRGQLRSEDYGKLYPVAYDESFTLPNIVKDNNPLTLPATHTVNGITANITWTSDNPGVISNSGIVTRPASETANVTMTARFEYGSKAFANNTFDITVYSDEAIKNETDKSYLEEAAQSLGQWYGPITPVYGTDTNIAAMLKADLAANGYADVDVSVKSIIEIYDGAAIAPNGDICYFYADPNRTQALWFGQYRVTFILSKGAEQLDVEDLIVNLYWDKSKVEAVMRSEILSGVTDQVVLAENSDKDNIMSDLVLPKVVDDKKWTQIEWTSSDPGAIFISNKNQGTADTLFTPFAGKIIRGEEDKEVTLTAKFIFRSTTLTESEIALYKVFTVKVNALAATEVDAIRAGLLKYLDTGFNAVGLRDYVTGQKLTEASGIYRASNDIQLPTTRDFGVDGKSYPITITSSDNDTISVPNIANAARVMVYRPMINEPTKTVTLTVTITDVAKGISASKKFIIEVQALSQSEIDDALALMDRVKTTYFDGLNDGRYADEFSVFGGLHSFHEAAWNSDKSDIDWIYDVRQSTNSGIIADELTNWADQEAWRAFRSSDMAIIDHETLHHISQPNEDTFVRIDSVLTHDVYRKYAQMYAGKPGYEIFEQLYKQPVRTYVMVEGKNHPHRSPEELKQMLSDAIACIDTPISAGFALFGTKQQATARVAAAMSASSEEVLINTTVSGLEAGTTVFGLFRKALADKGYTYKAVGSYVKSVTDAQGNTLSERDGGPNSGWIYTVNGKMPSIYMNGYSLKQGDEVVVRFTNDYTQENDFDGDDNNGGSPADDSPNDGEPAGGGTGAQTSTAASTPLTIYNATTAVANAIRINSVNANGVLIVRFQNISEVSKHVFDAMVKAATVKGIKAYFDSMNAQGVDVRLYIDPSAVIGDLNVAASTTNATTKATKNLFEKFFNNKAAVISFGHQGSFGDSINVAAKVDLTGMNTKNLVFYVYDKKTNTYRQIANPTYWIDSNGYLRFSTVFAGDIIVSDGALVKKQFLLK